MRGLLPAEIAFATVMIGASCGSRCGFRCCNGAVNGFMTARTGGFGRIQRLPQIVHPLLTPGPNLVPLGCCLARIAAAMAGRSRTIPGAGLLPARG